MPTTYDKRFSSIVEQILAFASSSNLVREVTNLSPNFKQLPDDVLRYT